MGVPDIVKSAAKRRRDTFLSDGPEATHNAQASGLTRRHHDELQTSLLIGQPCQQRQPGLPGRALRLAPDSRPPTLGAHDDDRARYVRRDADASTPLRASGLLTNLDATHSTRINADGNVIKIPKPCKEKACVAREKMIGMMFEQSDQIQKRTIALGKELAAIKEERVEAEKELQVYLLVY